MFPQPLFSTAPLEIDAHLILCRGYSMFNRGKQVYRFCVLAVLSFILCSIQGCVITGTSTGEMKRALQKTTFYQLTKTFYPDGTPADGGFFGRISEVDRSRMAEELQKQSDSLCGRIRAHAAEIAKEYPTFNHDFVPSRIRVTNQNRPIIKADGKISIDVRVIQSLFIGSLVRANLGISPKDPRQGSSKPSCY